MKYLSQAKHKNIIEFYDILERENSKFEIVMELADCGTLYDYIHKEKDQKRNEYTDLTALSWMCQLAEVRFILIEFLHIIEILIFLPHIVGPRIFTCHEAQTNYSSGY